MSKLRVSPLDIENILCVKQNKALSLALSVRDEALLCHSNNSYVQLGNTPPPHALVALSESFDAPTYSTYCNNCVSIWSCFTGEEIFRWKTNTSRFLVGEHTVAFACKNGIAAIALSDTNCPIWIWRGDATKARIVYGADDVLYIVRTEKRQFVISKHSLQTINWQQSQVQKVTAISASEPNDFGKLMLYNNSISWVFQHPDGLYNAVYNLCDNTFTTQCSAIDASFFATRNYKITISNSTACVCGPQTLANLIHYTTDALVPQKILLLRHFKSTFMIDADCTAAIAVDNSALNTCFLKTNNKLVQCSFDTTQIPQPHFKGATPINKVFTNLGVVRTCQLCRRTLNYTDADERLCRQCIVPHTLAWHLGRAFSYAKNKFGYTPTREDATLLRCMFVTDPVCAWSGNKCSKKTKLIFSKIDTTRPMDGSNTILLDIHYARFVLPEKIQKKARRFITNCQQIIQRGLTTTY